MPDIFKTLWMQASKEQIDAAHQLHTRGLAVFVHYGIQNAVQVLHDMDEAIENARLYEFMRDRLGIVTH